VGSDGSEESLETQLAAIEDECNDILVGAKFDTYPWPVGSREKLALYAALLYSRVTQRRTSADQNFRTVHSQLRDAASDERLLKELACGLSIRIGKAVSEQVIRDAIWKHIEELATPASAKNSFVSELRQNAEYIAALLLAKNPWRVLRQERSEFVATDNPLITFVPLGNGKLHPGYGFRKTIAVAAFPLAPDACLLMGDAWRVGRTLDALTIRELNEAFISICDRYVYSRTYSDEVRKTVEQHGGSFRYGVNALMPIGMKLPTARQFLRFHFGLNPDESEYA